MFFVFIVDVELFFITEWYGYIIIYLPTQQLINVCFQFGSILNNETMTILCADFCGEHMF